MLSRLPALFLLAFIFSLQGEAQLFRSTQTKMYRVIPDTIVLDSLSLVPGSISYRMYPPSDVPVTIDYRRHALVFSGDRPDSLIVHYRRFPYNFEKLHYHKDQTQLYTDLSRDNPFTIRYNNKTRNDVFVEDGLNKNGNISRGISFGNNQDVVVNSNLNLQVSGKLTPEIDLLMAATDNNIPFQADGTTAQLQEFDKVFIQLSNESNKLIVGDYQLSRPQSSYFMNFYKRAQGFSFDNVFRDSIGRSPLTFRTSMAGAVSKGRFARQIFFGIENNQGPYRLRGADNETFIIVLSGTENIYIDGKLLQRGQENDYTIDYNTGEISFTARQLITKDKRIVAEFQYAERNYARSLFFFGEEMAGKKGKVYLNFYNEQDNKNRPLQQTLTQDQKNVMYEAGDSLSQAFYSGAEEAPFNSTDVFYKQMDTLVSGVYFEDIYVYSTNPEEARYRLKFSTVGTGRGNYIQQSSSANGRVFVWVAPVNGVPQGSYEPVIPLVTPKQKQMLVGGFTHSLNAMQSFGAEGVYTKNDINRFSDQDKGNDEGSGVKMFGRNGVVLRNDERAVTKGILNVQYEFLQSQFSQVERFRSIEFERDWNRPLNGALRNDQHVGSVELGVLRNTTSSVNYVMSMFREGTQYQGLRHQLAAMHENRDLTLRYSGSLLNTSDVLDLQSTRFYRHKTFAAQRIERIRLSLSDEYEKNLLYHSQIGTLLPRAYDFWEWEAAISNADSSDNNARLFYRERRDKLAYDNELSDSTFARNIGLQTSVFSIRNNPFTVLVTYRQLELKNVVGNALKPDNTLLNRIEYSPRYFRGLVTASLFYETGYGMENKREFHYIEVAPGQGQYTWIDYNDNGIKELNEFEVGLYADQRNYVRVYTPTNDYVKVLQNQLSAAMNLRPASVPVTGGAGPFRAFVNRWALQTAVRLDNRSTGSEGYSHYSPFARVNDSLLLARNNNLRQSVFFNQNSAVFGADYTYISNQSRQLLTNGLENRGLLSHELRSRVNFLRSWSVNGTAILSEKSYTSDFFESRNFLLHAAEGEGQLAFQPNTVFRAATRYNFTEKLNQVQGGERAYLQTYGIDLKSNQAEKGSFNARADMILITYTGAENTSVAYEMLAGLRPGKNYTWELSYQRNLNSNIQVSITYSGRLSEATPVVHLGGAQVRAMF